MHSQAEANSLIMLVYFLLFVAFYVLTQQLLHRLRNLPPAPFPNLPLIGHLYLLKKPLHRALSKVSARYGPVVLLQLGSRRVLVVSSPSAAEDCLGKNDIIFANRPRLLAGKHVGYNYTSLVWASYGDHWRNLRRIASLELLSTHRLQMLMGIRADEVRSLIRGLSGRKERLVDMKAAFFEHSLNIMMMMIAGKRYYGDSVAEVEEAKTFREIVIETFKLSSATNIGDFLPWMKWAGDEKKFIALREKRDKFMQTLIEQHRRAKTETCDSGSGKKTLIEVLLFLQETEPEYYRDEIIRGLMLVMLSAGTDTSAVTMEWALSLLLNHPEVLKKAQAEIDERVGKERLVEESDLANLPYLHCIINETLRMFPAGPLLVPHECSEEIAVGGFRVPRGTMLLVNLWVIQNDSRVWEQPRSFKPERFQGLEGVRDGYKLMPFGSGRRGCPGEGLATRVVGLTLAALLQCFHFQTADGTAVDLTEGSGLTMPKLRPLHVKCSPRPTMIPLISSI